MAFKLCPKGPCPSAKLPERWGEAEGTQMQSLFLSHWGQFYSSLMFYILEFYMRFLLNQRFASELKKWKALICCSQLSVIQARLCALMWMGKYSWSSTP